LARILSFAASSRFQFGYLAQPSKRQLVAASSRAPAASRTRKIGHMSRVQPRSVAARKKSSCSSGAPAFASARFAAASCAASFTIRRTRSLRAMARMISAKAQGMAPNLPGQSRALCGQASQVAACGSHSAGMWKPSEAGVAARPFRARFMCRGGAW